MALYSIWNMIYNNCRLLIISSAQTCLNFPDRLTGGAKTSTSQCELRKGHDGIRNYDAYRVDFSASILDTICFPNILFFLSRFAILISWTLHEKLCIDLK